MVKVWIKRHGDCIMEIEIKDHAGFAPNGQDLVCAGVSSIAVGMMNALEQLAADTCSFQMEAAYIRIRVMMQSEQAQLLLQAMEVQLLTMQTSYKQYINISNQEV